MAENAEKSKQSQEQPLADDKITIARAKQIEKDLVDLCGFQSFRLSARLTTESGRYPVIIKRIKAFL